MLGDAFGVGELQRGFDSSFDCNQADDAAFCAGVHACDYGGGEVGNWGPDCSHKPEVTGSYPVGATRNHKV